MKRLLALMGLTAALLFTGCGGGNGDANGDGPEPLSVMSFNVAGAEQTYGYAQVVLNIESNQSDDVTVELSQFTPKLDGFSFGNVRVFPNPLVFTYPCRQQVAIAFNYAPSNVQIPLASLRIDYVKTVKSNYSDSKVQSNESFTLCCPTLVNDVNYTQYTIKAIPSDINVYDVNITTAIDVIVQDADGTPLADEQVTAELSSTLFGTLDKYSATTDDNGKVTFTYTAPPSLDGIRGRTVPFDIWVDKDPNARTSVLLHF